MEALLECSTYRADLVSHANQAASSLSLQTDGESYSRLYCYAMARQAQGSNNHA